MSELIEMKTIDTFDELPALSTLSDPSIEDLTEWILEVIDVEILRVKAERGVAHRFG